MSSNSMCLVPLSSLDSHERPRPSNFYNGLFRSRGDTFMAFNGDKELMTRLPTTAQASAPSSANSLRSEIYRTAWMNLDMPHLVFLPQYHVYNGPLLECLDVTPRTISIEPVTSHLPIENIRHIEEKVERWVLSGSILERWLKLEGFLRAVLAWLCEKTRDLFPQDYRGIMHGLPVSFGYTESYLSPERLVNAVLESRDAFLPLLAAITMRILVLDASQQLQWRQDLLQRVQIQPQVWDALEDIITQFVDTPVGGIVDFTTVAAVGKVRRIDWLFSLILRHRIRVPLYFCLGSGVGAQLMSLPSMRALHLELYDADLERFHDLPGQDPTIEWVYVSSDMHLWGVLPNPDFDPNALSVPAHRDLPADPPSAPPTRKLPPVENGSGQRPGETFKEFFARRVVENKRREARETPAAKTSRQQREAHARTGAPPGRKGARVFVWEDTNGDEFYIRRAKNRSIAASMWEEYTPAQRIYDGFADCWDLCEGIETDEQPAYYSDDEYDHPNAVSWDEAVKESAYLNRDDDPTNNDNYDDEYNAPPLDDADNVNNNNDFSFLQLPNGLAHDVVALLKDGTAAVDNLESYYEQESDHEPDSKALRGAPSMVNVIDSVLQARFGYTGYEGQYTKKMTLKASLNALGDDNFPKPLNDAVAALLQSILDANTLHDIPEELFDLRQEGMTFWDDRGIDVKLLEQPSAEAYERNVFVITPRGTDGRTILVFNSVSVLHIVRLGFREFENIVRELNYIGAEFHLVVEGLRLNWNPLMPRCFSLGVRQEGYHPSMLDYHAYVSLRNRFLRSPRGVLALYAGGIIARIARLVIEHPDNEIMGDDVDSHHADAKVDDPTTGRAMYYHRLTWQEEDLICGVYSIQMNQVNKAQRGGRQQSRTSWWPQPAAFFNSGLHVGWWSPNCERWFQKELEKREAGHAELWSQTKWKKNIRFYQNSLRIFNSYHRLGTEYLLDRLS